MNDHSNTNDRLPENEPTLHDTTVQNPCGQATVTPEPDYEAFGLWMDGELDKLVARWIHLAAPNASRPSRRRFAM
jgi:hypothetical protein